MLLVTGFSPATDTEVVAHLVHYYLQETQNLRTAVEKTLTRLDGAYALGVIAEAFPDTIVAARSGSPLVIGVGIDENFIASDQMALRQVTDRFIFLEEGDLVELSSAAYRIFDQSGNQVTRPINELDEADQVAEKGQYRHFMQKEIFEQPTVLANTLSGRLAADHIREAIFGYKADGSFFRNPKYSYYRLRHKLSLRPSG